MSQIDFTNEESELLLEMVRIAFLADFIFACGIINFQRFGQVVFEVSNPTP